MQIDVFTISGKKAGRQIDLPDEIFGIEPNEHAIYLAVKQYLAARRQGTHKVKTRMEVKGSSRKLHKQKGTGGSRKGNIRNPLYKGGGTIFGPKPHSYDFKLNRKVKDLAKMSALSHKAKSQAIRIVEDFQLEQPKTKEFAGILEKLELGGKKTLFVSPALDHNLQLSLRNLPEVEGILLADINTYAIVNAETLVFTESAAQIFLEEENGENQKEEGQKAKA
jgi:large subunit ribosomal protein L4